MPGKFGGNKVNYTQIVSYSILIIIDQDSRLSVVVSSQAVVLSFHHMQVSIEVYLSYISTPCSLGGIVYNVVCRCNCVNTLATRAVSM